MANETTSTQAISGRGRDSYVDFIRAFSLLVVVAWHWVFTIIIWRDDGPHASNPIGFTKGVWLATWALQIMPMFFYVGGYGHLRSWQKAQARGLSIWALVGARAKQLAIPAFALLGVWIVIGFIISFMFDPPWIWRAIKLVVSPLWFMAVYLMLVLLLPIALWLHRRFDTVAIVAMAGLAGLIDVARFRYDMEWLGIFNMVIIWGLCHQLGFFYERIVAGRRTLDWTLLLGGAFTLAALVGSGLYPGSMVGVPGERSNMAPPTMCIVALVFLQAGLVEILRPAVAHRLELPGWAAMNRTINRFALPLFLFHTTGMALGMALNRGLNSVISRNSFETESPTIGWWLTRPFAFILPLLCTLPVIYLFGRQWRTNERREHVNAPA